MHVRHYFAYGSNMNTERVAERGLEVVEVNGGRLEGYVLTFNKISRLDPSKGHANIEFAPGAATEGVLYELADGAEIFKMDPYERAPWNYGREVVRIEHASGPTWAWTYFANPAVRQAGLRPPAEYLAHLLAGREYLSDEYYAALLTWGAG